MTPTSLNRCLAACGLALILASMGCQWSPVASGTTASRDRDAEQFVQQADAMLEEGKTDEALFVLARAIEKNPRLTVAHMKTGEIYKESGDYESAAEAYGNAAEVEPRNFDAQYNHGLMLHLIDRLTEAVRAYLKALAVRPDDFDANFNLATAYLQLNESSQSLTYARRAVRLNPEHGPAHANLGAVYSALDRHREAVREYEAASELMTLTPDILLNWAESLGKIGRYEEMAVMLESVIDESPSAAALERLGFARFKLRQYEAAQAAFRESLERDGRYYPAMNGLGVCQLNEFLLSGKQDRGMHRRAMDNFQKSLRINRDQPRILELVTRYK
jgi:tetratricopeptide (TPR) repeat protein